MATGSPRPGRATGLTDRHRERGVLDQLVEAVRAGESRVLVLHGEPGVGKTALLDYLVRQASRCRMVRVVGVQSEMELAFAGLHLLCVPMLDRLDRLPGPQRDALRTAFGLSDGPAPDRFRVGLALLSLLSEAAAERPLICVIDDQQWQDRASAQALGFVARRLAADPVGLVFATRVPGEELAGLPELGVAGLADDDARTLLGSALTGPLDARIRDQIVAETRGNPLALLELPRGLTSGQLAGGFGFGLPGAVPLAGRIEESFQRQLEALPAAARRLVQLAAADPSGDPSLVWRAAGQLGIPPLISVDPRLMEIGARVRFRHPLVRSAAYQSASATERRESHQALAQATDPRADPDRRAWHLAQAASGPDEDVAAELERSAGRAQARGGMAAAAAFLERSMQLTADPVRRTERALAAAQASLQAGAFDTALGLLATAAAGPLDESASARADLLRAHIAFAAGPGRNAPPLLLKAARRLEPVNLELARETYLDAWGAAIFAGSLADAGELLEISRAAQALPPSSDPGPADLLLDGLTLLITDGRTAAAPTLRRAVSAFASADISVTAVLRWGWMTQAATTALWDDDGWRAILARHLPVVRAAGALDRLPIYLAAMGTASVWSGDFGTAEAVVAEAEAVSEATGTHIAPFGALQLAALRGDQAQAMPLIEATVREAGAAGQGIAVAYAHWAAAILANGLGRYPDALAAAQQATEDTLDLYVSMWALPELIEAAARSGNASLAASALKRLAETTRAGGTDFGLGIEARSRALLSTGEAAEGCYTEAIDRLGRTQLRPELARAHLLYGEWLRRESRRVDARASCGPRTRC
jgi:tetratricopeptide (TPR) repeat protein